MTRKLSDQEHGATGKTSVEGMPFDQSEISGRGFQLRLSKKIPPQSVSVVVAYVDGIEIGRASMDQGMGEHLTIGCHYFPDTEFPVTIKFAAETGDVDVAPSVTVRHLNDIVGLIGYAELDDVELRTGNGMVTGRANLKGSTLQMPPILCRVNGVLHRDVKIESLTPMAGGDTRVKFSALIEATDLTDSGIQYEFYTLPSTATIGNLVVAPVRHGEENAAALAKLQQEVQQLSRQFTHEIAMSEARRQEQDKTNLKFMDRLGQYLLSVVFDETLTSRSPEKLSRADKAISGFYDLVQDAAEQEFNVARPRKFAARADSQYFADGWHGMETTGAGVPFRWMHQRGGVHNPYPDMDVTEITLICLTRLDDGVFPIRILVDGRMMEAELDTTASGNAFFVKVVPAESLNFYRMDIVANQAFSPKQLDTGADMRELSIAVNACVFTYDQINKSA